MTTLQATAAGGAALDERAVVDLQSKLRGALIRPGDARYEEARHVYNAMIDRRPALIVRCADVADVISCVHFARENDVLLAVRGGAHNGPGLGTCDGGLVVDLAHLNGIRIDPAARTARVEGGCLWGDVDHASHAFGLATPSGILSTTGVGGLTLGGGHGHLTRKYGLTIDNLLSADVVLADGRLVTANPGENEDLFWAIRGGGGNFGVVTSFLFQMHPVHTILGGMHRPIEQASEVLTWYRAFLPAAPEDLNGFFAFLTVAARAFLPRGIARPEDVWRGLVLSGPEEVAERVFAPIRTFGPPALSTSAQCPIPRSKVRSTVSIRRVCSGTGRATFSRS